MTSRICWPFYLGLKLLIKTDSWRISNTTGSSRASVYVNWQDFMKHSLLWDIIIDPCLNFNGDLAKPLRQGWGMNNYVPWNFMDILRIRMLNSVLVYSLLVKRLLDTTHNLTYRQPWTNMLFFHVGLQFQHLETSTHTRASVNGN